MKIPGVILAEIIGTAWLSLPSTWLWQLTADASEAENFIVFKRASRLASNWIHHRDLGHVKMASGYVIGTLHGDTCNHLDMFW